MAQRGQLVETHWETSLFGCFEDMSTCCYGFWCCPCMACSTTEKFGECMCLPLLDIISPALAVIFGVPLCAPAAGLSLRVAIRHKYGIKACWSTSSVGTLCKDIAISCFCDWCSWCQMAREIKHRKSRPALINMQPVVMQPTPAVPTQITLINQNFSGPVPGSGYQPPYGPGTSSGPGYKPPSYSLDTGPIITKKLPVM